MGHKTLLYSQQQRFRSSAKSNSVLIVLTLWSCIHIFGNSTEMLEPRDVYLNGYKWIIKTSFFFFQKSLLVIVQKKRIKYFYENGPNL